MFTSEETSPVPLQTTIGDKIVETLLTKLGRLLLPTSLMTSDTTLNRERGAALKGAVLIIKNKYIVMSCLLSQLMLSPIVGKECDITTPPETEPTV